MTRTLPFPDPELLPIFDLLNAAGIACRIREIMPVYDEIVIPAAFWFLSDRTITICPNVNEDCEFFISVFDWNEAGQGKPEFLVSVHVDYIHTIPALVKALSTL